MTINDRVNNLLKQLILEEKMAQMVALNDDFKSLVKFDKNSNVNLNDVKIEFSIGVEHITRLSEIKGGNSQISTGKSEPLTSFEQAKLSNAIQKYFIEETRLGIPVIFHEETFGEDPHLTTVIGNAAIKGFQGDNTFSDNEHVLATLKHFAAHGQPEGGINTGPENYSERVLRESHFAPFRNIMNQNKILNVMATYNEIDGVPAHANKWLINDLLRNELGFNGMVISDWATISNLVKSGNAINEKDAARQVERESMVLLKNNNLLPLSKNIKTIAVIGPLANRKKDMMSWWGANHSQGA